MDKDKRDESEALYKYTQRYIYVPLLISYPSISMNVRSRNRLSISATGSFNGLRPTQHYDKKY